jgi:hypothetical protein
MFQVPRQRSLCDHGNPACHGDTLRSSPVVLERSMHLDGGQRGGGEDQEGRRGLGRMVTVVGLLGNLRHRSRRVSQVTDNINILFTCMESMESLN